MKWTKYDINHNEVDGGLLPDHIRDDLAGLVHGIDTVSVTCTYSDGTSTTYEREDPIVPVDAPMRCTFIRTETGTRCPHAVESGTRLCRLHTDVVPDRNDWTESQLARAWNPK